MAIDTGDDWNNQLAKSYVYNRAFYEAKADIKWGDSNNDNNLTSGEAKETLRFNKPSIFDIANTDGDSTISPRENLIYQAYYQEDSINHSDDPDEDPDQNILKMSKEQARRTLADVAHEFGFDAMSNEEILKRMQKAKEEDFNYINNGQGFSGH